jgi:hypothetical protein
MVEGTKKSDDTWLGRAQADGWHMSEAGLPESPDQGPWRKALVRRVVQIAVIGAAAWILPLVTNSLFVVPVFIVVFWAISEVPALIASRERSRTLPG